MINRTQNRIYNIGNNQNKRILIPQNKQQMNQISKTTNNSLKKPLISNAAFNNKNIRNNNFFQNQNLNSNNNSIEPDELSKAILMIRRELKKKDDRILELEKKVQELTKKLNLLINNKSDNNLYNISSTTPYKNPQKEEYDLGEDMNYKIKGQLPTGGYNMGYSGMKNLAGFGNNNIRLVSQNIPNYNSDNENVIKRHPGYDNLSHSNDNSLLTYNGIHSNSKKEVKQYLKEVKSKIEPKKFKEFIRNIKLLTAKNNEALNREIIMENVKIIFGEEHKDLYVRFETIIGTGK
jgi:hypothetical protein